MDRGRPGESGHRGRAPARVLRRCAKSDTKKRRAERKNEEAKSGREVRGWEIDLALVFTPIPYCIYTVSESGPLGHMETFGDMRWRHPLGLAYSIRLY